jgi:hypothetical protein
MFEFLLLARATTADEGSSNTSDERANSVFFMFLGNDESEDGGEGEDCEAVVPPAILSCT